MSGLRRAAVSVTAVGAVAAAMLPQSAFADTAASAAFVEERVYVETTVDTDGDGKRDRVAIDISRPNGSDKVPVIFEHTPYKTGLGDVPNHGVDLAKLPQETGRRPGIANGPVPRRVVPEPQLSGWLDDHFAPLGYAAISGQSVGTGASDGCPTTGDMGETAGAVAVIDWLNGRAKGFSSSGAEVKATWSTGNVGMTGISYNGTLPNMAATTGVPGLKAIVPVAAIGDWYDYYRANGLVVAPGGYQGEDADILARAVRNKRPGCTAQFSKLNKAQDRVTGDHSAFWAARDYVNKADKVKAGVFVVHGLNDWNVKGKNAATWYEALRKNDVPRRIWWHRGKHDDPRSHRSDYAKEVQRWFDHFLKGVDNGVTNEPKAEVQGPDGNWRKLAEWPDPAAKDVELHLGATSATAPGTLTGSANPSASEQSFTDEGKTKGAGVLVANPDQANGNRLVYRAAALAGQASLSGTPKVKLRLAVENKTAANLTVLVVDYTSSGTPTIVTRGWMDPQNHAGIQGTPLTPGKAYDLSFNLEPKDYVFAKGSRIGVVIISTDYDFTLRPAAGTKLRVAPGASSVTLPLAGYSARP
ncbi:Xaa-Pro dipeptidyl-peptidase [Pilimelia columellifera]|uniref:Xaa-Pro dipeptidyl-peptidase n=1 Tax=Pilimelia columellifera subsp. columellifera TaxID=706583 RepID=A0ABN3NH67_9ACTN